MFKLFATTLIALSALPACAQTFMATQEPGRTFRIKGTGARGGGVVVSGAANKVIFSDTQGNFEDVVNVPTLGMITVQDSKGVIGTAALTDIAPVISMFGLGGPTSAFSGTVAHAAPAGMSVTFSGPNGVNGNIAAVKADGTWTTTWALPTGLRSGTVITATVVDWYGQTSVKTFTIP